MESPADISTSDLTLLFAQVTEGASGSDGQCNGFMFSREGVCVYGHFVRGLVLSPIVILGDRARNYYLTPIDCPEQLRDHPLAARAAFYETCDWPCQNMVSSR